MRRLRRSEAGKRPASAHAAYSTGAAWPFDKTKRSLLAPRGLLMEYFMVLKNSTDITSAADAHDVGCLSTEDRTTFIFSCQLHSTFKCLWTNRIQKPMKSSTSRLLSTRICLHTTESREPRGVEEAGCKIYSGAPSVSQTKV